MEIDCESSPFIHEVPWETRNLGRPSFEITHQALEEGMLGEVMAALASRHKGNYFVQLRVDATDIKSARLVEDASFRLAELSIDPWISFDRAALLFNYLENSSNYIPKEVNKTNIRMLSQSVTKFEQKAKNEIIRMSQQVFRADRFHTDPSCTKAIVDYRVTCWIEEMFLNSKHQCDVVYLDDDLVGFIIWKGERFILGGISAKFIGKGFAKMLYLESMSNVMKSGQETLCATISVNNLEVLNLYSRLGFSFRNPKYIFHFWA